jgi:hypothetical protein
MTYKLYLTKGLNECYLFKYPKMESKEDFTLFIRKIQLLTCIKNKFKLEYLDCENDFVSIKSIDDVKCMYEQQLPGSSVKLYIKEIQNTL